MEFSWGPGYGPDRGESEVMRNAGNREGTAMDRDLERWSNTVIKSKSSGGKLGSNPSSIFY